MPTLVAAAMSQGLAIAALAFGFALVYWSTRVFFVLLGALYVLSPLLVADLEPRWGLGGALPLAALALAAAAFLLGWANHERLLRRAAPPGVHFTCSLALYFLVSELAVLRWGSSVRTLATLPALTGLAGSAWLQLPASQLVVIGSCLSLVGAVSLYLRWGGMGTQLRALADNPAELGRSGYDPGRLRAMAFIAAGLVACGASTAVAVDLALGPQGGMVALIPAATATLLTTAGRWRQLLAWSLALGLLRTAVTFTVSGAWQDPITLGLLVLGLLGRRLGGPRPGLELAARGIR
jgi:branched-chain amino acid transport system permease protein